MGVRTRHWSKLLVAAAAIAIVAAIAWSDDVQDPGIEHRVEWLRNDEGNVEGYRATIDNATGKETRVTCTIEVLAPIQAVKVLATTTFETKPIPPGERLVREGEFELLRKDREPFEIHGTPASACEPTR